jgi:hypothetical protein
MSELIESDIWMYKSYDDAPVQTYVIKIYYIENIDS